MKKHFSLERKREKEEKRGKKRKKEGKRGNKVKVNGSGEGLGTGLKCLIVRVGLLWWKAGRRDVRVFSKNRGRIFEMVRKRWRVNGGNSSTNMM